MRLQTIIVGTTYAMGALIPVLLRINFIRAKLSFPQDVIVALAADVLFLSIRTKLLIVDCQCRRCACSNPRRNNRSHAVSREDSESRRGGCCGSGGGDDSDIAKVPQRV